MRFKQFIGVAILAASSTVIASAAMAQEADPALPGRAINQPILQTVDRAFFGNDRDFYRNRSIYRQINVFLGQGSLVRNGFVENEIARDGAAIDVVYQEILRRQVSSDPIIRTPDLPNPYNTSVLLLPSSAASTQVLNEPIQPQPQVSEPTPVQPATSAPRGPVRALW